MEAVVTPGRGLGSGHQVRRLGDIARVLAHQPRQQRRGPGGVGPSALAGLKHRPVMVFSMRYPTDSRPPARTTRISSGRTRAFGDLACGRPSPT